MNTNSKVPELFGSMVFNESVMKDRLPKDIFRALKKTIREGTALDPAVANVVASAMKDWRSPRALPILPTGSSP